MLIDDKLVSYLADSSCLTLSECEKSRFTGDLQKIITFMAQLGELNTDGVQEYSHPFNNVNIFRDDEVFPSFDRELILKNAPVKNNEMIIAPKII